jgi:hypothetical protein
MYPKKQTKEEFVQFLIEKNKIDNDKDIERVNQLKESVEYNEKVYNLNIIVTDNQFEVNYYNKQNIEFLIPYKTFTDLELCLNFIECELNRKKISQ